MQILLIVIVIILNVATAENSLAERHDLKIDLSGYHLYSPSVSYSEKFFGLLESTEISAIQEIYVELLNTTPYPITLRKVDLTMKGGYLDFNDVYYLSIEKDFQTMPPDKNCMLVLRKMVLFEREKFFKFEPDFESIPSYLGSIELQYDSDNVTEIVAKGSPYGLSRNHNFIKSFLNHEIKHTEPPQYAKELLFQLLKSGKEKYQLLKALESARIVRCY